MAKTKKAGSAGRFGVRYGRKIRFKVNEIEKKQKAKHECPSCKKPSVVRKSFGIWQCKGCDHKFAGRAYVPGGV